MEAKDGHGRALTTTPIAAGWYRLAQRQAFPSDDPRRALRRAVDADAAFALAAVDLRALTGDPTPARIAGPLTGWERHHCEIVAAAVGGHRLRAAALLRQHLGEVACDSLALRIVAHALAGAGAAAADVDDLLAEAPTCHRLR
jgi:hypothetical protein